MECHFPFPLDIDFEWQMPVCTISILFLKKLKSSWCAGRFGTLTYALQVSVENIILKQ